MCRYRPAGVPDNRGGTRAVVDEAESATRSSLWMPTAATLNNGILGRGCSGALRLTDGRRAAATRESRLAALAGAGQQFRKYRGRWRKAEIIGHLSMPKSKPKAT